MTLLSIITIIAAGVIVFRSIAVAPYFSFDKWRGPKWRLVGIALGYSLMAGGAASVAWGIQTGTMVLMCGVVLKVLSDPVRREASQSRHSQNLRFPERRVRERRW